MNSIAIVFNNLYSRLCDLYTLAKTGESQGNIKFGATQVENILLQNQFSVDPTFIISDSKGKDEGVGCCLWETWMATGTKVLGVPFHGELFNLGEDMDIEPQIGGISNRSKGP